MTKLILKLLIGTENDVVVARQRARHIAALLGFESQDQIRIATAVSEIARNAFRYAKKGTIEFLLENGKAGQGLLVRISDTGPGISNLENILDGSYQSTTGMGRGLLGAKRLMDYFDIETCAGEGTTVCLSKRLPRRAAAIGSAELVEIAQTLAQNQSQSAVEEVHNQNQELLRALDELRIRQDELTNLNHELEDTNRGVVALYAELADKADHLRQADEMKSRFLWNMSHEFRTPLNSVLALSRLLLDRVDGELTSEQEKQVHFIRRSAEALTELVNDLLDLAKVEAGKVAITPTWFSVENLFGALRGMLRPLLLGKSLNLVFEDSSDIPEFFTDEGKVSQIMRNLISNALKFTEKGEVRVSASLSADGAEIDLTVADTGIGIAPEHRELVFQEFAQVENAFQRHVKGTGLGLPLSRKMSELLGGRIVLGSGSGTGSTFTVKLPRLFGSKEARGTEGTAAKPLPTVLLIDDEDVARYLVRQALSGIELNFLEAANGEKGLQIAIDKHPNLIFLDLGLPIVSGERVLENLKEDSRTAAIPVVVVTSQVLKPDQLAVLNRKAVAVVSKADLGGRRASEQFALILTSFANSPSTEWRV